VADMQENGITERLTKDDLCKIKDDLKRLSAVDQTKYVIEKIKDEKDFFTFIIDVAEKEVLKPEAFIDLCRKTKMYNICKDMVASDLDKHGCIDLSKLDRQLLDLGNDEFENLAEKKGSDRETLEKIGMGKKICVHVFMFDLVHSIKNEKSIKMKDIDNKDLEWLGGCYLDYRNRYWSDTSYFWFRVTWSVASIAAVGAGFFSALFLVNPVFSISAILVGIASHYLGNYWFRSEREIYDGKNRLKKLYGILGSVKEVFSKNLEKNKNPFIKMSEFAGTKTELRFTKSYSNRHFYKNASRHLLKAGLILGGLAFISGVLLIPPVSAFFLAPVATFVLSTLSVSLPVVPIVATIFGISAIFGIASGILAYLSDKNYKKLKSTISDEKNKIKKEQGEKPVELKEDFWKKLNKDKNSKSPFVEPRSSDEPVK